MAVDTLRKRTSAYSFNAYWVMPSILPDGSLEQADRQHSLWNYAGILAPLPAHIPTAIPVVVGGPYKPLPQIFVSWISFVLPTWTMRAPTFAGHKFQQVEAHVPLVPFLVQAVSRQIGIAPTFIVLKGPLALPTPTRLIGYAASYVLIVKPLMQLHEKVFWGESHLRVMEDEAILLSFLLGDSLKSPAGMDFGH